MVRMHRWRGDLGFSVLFVFFFYCGCLPLLSPHTSAIPALFYCL